MKQFWTIIHCPHSGRLAETRLERNHSSNELWLHPCTVLSTCYTPSTEDVLGFRGPKGPRPTAVLGCMQERIQTVASIEFKGTVSSVRWWVGYSTDRPALFIGIRVLHWRSLNWEVGYSMWGSTIWGLPRRGVEIVRGAPSSIWGP